MNTDYKKAKEEARELFFGTELTQAEIAKEVGVTPKSVCLWISEGNWEHIRMGVFQGPRYITAQLNTELMNINQAIMSRPPGKQMPTKEEAELRRIIVQTANMVRHRESLGSEVELMMKLINYIREDNLDLAKQVTALADGYLKERWSDVFEKSDKNQPRLRHYTSFDSAPF